MNPVKKVKRNTSGQQNKAIKNRLAARHGWICWYCGQDISATSGVEARLEHIVPLDSGGTNHESNLALACEYCDRAKFNKPFAQFIEWLHRPKKSVFAAPASKS